MALSTALNLAVSGLSLNQRETALVSQNISRANQPSYTRKTFVTSDSVGQQGTIGLKGVVQREIDLEVQKQLTQSTPDTGYAEVKSYYASRLDQLMGEPGKSSSISGSVSAFNNAVKALAATPESASERLSTVSKAKTLAASLNQFTDDIQAMRSDVEGQISDSVNRANELLRSIAKLNENIVAQKASGQDYSSLEDARDQSVKELSTLLDVQTQVDRTGKMTVATQAGLVLVDAEAVKLNFDKTGTLSARALWTADPKSRGTGSITIGTADGPIVDIIDSGLIRSGKIAGYIDVRDRMMVDAQNQADALAAAIASALSDKSVAGTSAASGGKNGFDLDLNGLKAGNTITLNYFDRSTGENKVVSFVRVDDPATLPLSNNATGNSKDRVVGVDFSTGLNNVATQIQAALGSRFAVSNPSGTTLQILDDGATNKIDITNLSARVTLSGLQVGETGMPLFTDGVGGTLFTGSFDGANQKQGFAGRITVNAAVVKDPSLLVAYASGVAAGDPKRPNDLSERLTKTIFDFGSDTAVVSGNSSFSSTIEGFSNAMTSHWGMVSEDAKTALVSQNTIQNNLENRFADTSKVNADAELARLTELQNAYAANARVMTAVKDMLDILMRV